MNLVNANFTQEKNFYAVDLIDVNNRVAVQVTSTNTIDKIRDTVRQFIKHERFKSFDILYIYLLSEKQRTYTSKVSDEVQGRFQFDVNNSILDYIDILRRVSAEPSLEKIEKRKQEITGIKSPVQTQRVFSNLLEISFGSNIFISELKIAKQALTEELNVICAV